MTLPKEVSEKIDALLKADQAYEEKVAWPGCNETEREEVQYAWDCAREDLSDAILSALSAAREGALREAAEAMERALNAWCVSSTDGRSVDALVRDTLASLASRPEPEPGSVCAYRGPCDGLFCKDRVCAPEPAPENGGLPCPVCDDGIEGRCPRCAVPSPRSTPEDR